MTPHYPFEGITRRAIRLIIFLMLPAMLWNCDDSDSDDNLDIRIPVSVQELKRGYIEAYLSTTATVQALKTTTLNAEIDGYYRLANNPRTQKPFAPGDNVKAGQTIIFLDNREFETTNRIDSKKLNLDISKREFEKQESLYEKGGVTLRELKNAESNFVNARYDYDNALLQQAKLRLSAPFAGIIVDLPYFTPQTRVTAATRLLQIMDYDRLIAEISFPGRELSRLKSGQRVLVTHSDIPEDTLSGSIDRVSPAVDPETRSIKATVIIDNPRHLLRPGMFVQLNVVVDSRKNTLIIPKEVILSKRRGKTVFVIDEYGANERIISTGLQNNRHIEVLEGLKAGERLVIKGFETLRNRSKIKLVQ